MPQPSEPIVDPNRAEDFSVGTMALQALSAIDCFLRGQKPDTIRIECFDRLIEQLEEAVAIASDLHSGRPSTRRGQLPAFYLIVCHALGAIDGDIGVFADELNTLRETGLQLRDRQEVAETAHGALRQALHKIHRTAEHRSLVRA